MTNHKEQITNPVATDATALDLPAEQLRAPTTDDLPAMIAPDEHAMRDVSGIEPALEQAAHARPTARETSLDLPADRLRAPTADDLPAGLVADEPVDDSDRLQDEAGMFER